MESVKELTHRTREKITDLLSEYKSNPNDEIYNEIVLEVGRGMDDILLMIESHHRKKIIEIREKARFIEISSKSSVPMYRRLVVIKVGLMTTKRGSVGQYQVLWNKRHPLNFGGECASANATLENSALTAIIAMIAACVKMKLSNIALHFLNDSTKEMLKNLDNAGKDTSKISPFLLQEFKKARSGKGLKITVIDDTVAKHVVTRYGKFDDWW